MNTIGKFLKEARIRKGYSLSQLEDDTKIKRTFIVAVEKENWASLPDFPVTLGFVKNIAKYLGADERVAVAILKRDYPPQSLSINPKPDVGSKFFWSPRLTFLVGIGMVLFLILGYMGFQYVKFVAPPTLSVIQPKDEAKVKLPSVKVSGKTDANATVLVNNQPVLIEEDGSFGVEIEIFEGTDEIVVSATSRAGKETVVSRKILVTSD